MEQSKQQEEVLKIGKKIINDLNPENEDRLELLEKWMSHYIAELIYKAEHAENEEDREKYQKECFNTILKLWDRRSSLPMDSMPLGHIKSAINTLTKFKTEKEWWEKLQHSRSESWEGLAVNIHDTYMEAIRICLKAAIAEDAMEHEKVWLDDFGDMLSSEEKEIIEELDSFLEEPSHSFVFLSYGEEKTEKKEQKNRIDRAFDRLEAIVKEQKEAVEDVRKAFKENVD